MLSQAPTLETIQQLFEHHLQEHRRLPESARVRDLGSERALIQDYSGRVVYELLQNALDRSRRHILVRWDPASRCLEVANDGQPVSAHADKSLGRSDFHALLSLHSSTKNAQESIGNKGVGFRSVFAAAPQVEVWSRTVSGQWWGLRMRHPNQLQPAPEAEWTAKDVPSFYAPRFLDHGLDGRFSEYQTVVRLLGVRLERVQVLEQTVHELMRLPMRFLEHRAPCPKDLRIRFLFGEAHVEHRVTENAREIAVSATVTEPVSEAVRRDTGLDLETAEVRVMACTVLGEGQEIEFGESRHRGLYWSYLPTEQEAGFGVDVHADFYLSNSRRSLALRALAESENDSASDPAGWNRRLVQRAAQKIVKELWQRPELHHRDDFWAFAHPGTCRCEHLLFEVGRLLLNDDLAVIEDLIRRSFSKIGNWSLRRYIDLFSALEAWATYAYRQPACAGRQPRYRWQATLLEMVERSGAPVLPIVERMDETTLTQPVTVARPLVQGKKGQRRDKGDRIYLRHLSSDDDSAESLPAVVQNQGTFVTAFAPPGHGQDIAKHGLMEFSRPELLAQLQPGRGAYEHREVLRAALRLACHEPSQGGTESVIGRAQTTAGGPAWWLALAPTTTLSRAAQNLRSLHLPTMNGWEPAYRLTRGTGGPWPHVDERALASLLAEFSSNTVGGGCPPLDVDRVCLLFGIGVVPIDHHGGIPDWPETPDASLGHSILAHWERDLHPVFAAGLGAPALKQLRQTRWIHPTTAAEASFTLEPGVGEPAPYAPDDLWVQSQSGFRTRLLPRLIVVRESTLPAWALDLGIENPAHTQSEARIMRAFDRLRASAAAREDERALSDVYRRLVEGAFRLEPTPRIPLLHRHVDAAGTAHALEWDQPGYSIWHDPGGAESSALSAFRDVRIWIYRGATRPRAEALGLVHFAPGLPEVKQEGESDDALAQRLRDRVWEALPDLLAAASMAREEFDEQAAIRKQAVLQVQHHDRVWVRWHFADKFAERGRDDIGDVFVLPLETGDKALCFDGHELPLVECAFPLSEILCDNRAFGAIFRDGLYAWSRAGQDGPRASSVARFRRDHNLTEAEIAQWRGRLQEARLDDRRRQLWEARVEAVLRRFGGIDGAIRPGMIVTPALWPPTRGSDQEDISEEGLRQLLHEALQDDPQFRLLAPLVDFHTTHRERLHRESRTTYVAAAADRLGRDQWTERLLEELRIQGSGITFEDEAAFHQLRFDVDRALRRRYQLPLTDALAPSDAARAFARGEIPVSTLPATPMALSLRAFRSDSADDVPRPAVSEEAWLGKARRKASGGRRAEDAILSLAVKQALDWQRRDPQGFQHAIEVVRAIVKPAGEERYAEIGDPAGLRAFLHASGYAGDVGFDVLVPDEPSGAVLLVEVKRVAALDRNAAFFLTENERRRALGHLKAGRPWRLWLVASTGSVIDASSVIEHFRTHSGDVQTLLDAGLRPGEWMLVLQSAGDGTRGNA